MPKNKKQNLVLEFQSFRGGMVHQCAMDKSFQTQNVFIALGKQAIPYNKLWILKFLTPFPKFDL